MPKTQTVWEVGIGTLTFRSRVNPERGTCFSGAVLDAEGGQDAG